MWPDNETADDLIGFQIHADLIRAVVLNPQMLPVTVGVFGDWGGGKTSIMQMLERSLSQKFWKEGSPEAIECTNTAVVYINTWQFEGYDDAKAAILSSVLLRLQEHERFGAKVRKKALRLLHGVNVMRLARLSFKYGLPAVAAATAAGDVGPSSEQSLQPRDWARVLPVAARLVRRHPMGRFLKTWEACGRETRRTNRSTCAHSGRNSRRSWRTPRSRRSSC